MMLYVSERARQASRECPRAFACLDNGNGQLCKVSCCIDNAMHFIVCAHEEPCPYKHAFRSRLVCDCPVRREIYGRYRI